MEVLASRLRQLNAGHAILLMLNSISDSRKLARLDYAIAIELHKHGLFVLPRRTLSAKTLEIRDVQTELLSVHYTS